MTLSRIQPGSKQPWQPIADASGYLAPDNEEVWTKIDDEQGERNVAKLTRRGNLWFTDPRGGMYVYYTPTHWHYSESRP